MDTFDKKYQREYEILLGEVNSGNSNEKVKIQLIQSKSTRYEIFTYPA